MKHIILFAFVLFTTSIAMAENKKEKVIFIDNFNNAESIPNPKVWKLCDFFKCAWAQHFEHVKGYP